MSTIRLIHGDCLDVLRTLPDASVDCIVTDPPYAQTNESYESDIACRPEVWRECFRVAKPNAALVSFAGSPTYHRIASAIEAGGWRVRQMWGWIYRDGMITSAWPKEGFDRLAPAMDPICYATKGKVLLTLEREGDAWECWRPRPADQTYSGRSRTKDAPLCGNGHWPRSVVASDGIDGFQYFALSRGVDRKRRSGHPNQKPLALMRWIIAKLPGRVILDPFAGSATTLIAAIEEGRDAVGIERDPEYHTMGDARIGASMQAQPLFAGAAS